MEYTKENVRKLLENMAEPEYAKFSASLLGREAKVLGVRLPKLRALAKEIAKADGLEYLENTLSDKKSLLGSDDSENASHSHWSDLCCCNFQKQKVDANEISTEEPQYMEELMLYGVVIGMAKEKLEALFPYIERYVDRIDNWSLCDSFCCGLKQTKKQPELMWEFLRPYLRSEEEFKLRFGVVMLMNFYITPEYIEELLRIFDNIHHEGYYVKMAVAWALSVCLVKQWEKSFAYMSSSENHLDEFTYVKTIQKCRESFRLSLQQKGALTKLKEKRISNTRCMP